jgi:hypothetical protein
MGRTPSAERTAGVDGFVKPLRAKLTRADGRRRVEGRVGRQYEIAPQAARVARASFDVSKSRGRASVRNPMRTEDAISSVPIGVRTPNVAREWARRGGDR